MAQHRSLGWGVSWALVAGVAVGACGAPSAPPSVEPTPRVTSPDPATASPSAAPSVSPDASAAVTVDLGEVGVTPRGSRVTVHAFGPSDRSPEPPSGSDWLEADLEWCMPPDIVNEVTIGNLRYELKLEMGDATTIEPEAVADSPDEVYASEGSLSADECVRGALVFAVPTGVTPEYLLLVGSFGGMRWRLA